MTVKRIVHRRLPRKIEGHNRVKVGFPVGVDNEIIMRAIYNNFGTTSKNGKVHIPERPFMDNALRDNKPKYKKITRKSSAKILKGEVSMGKVISKLGLEAQNDIQDEIRDLRDPENAESTVKAKGSSNPLLDTGEMLGAVTFETYND